MENEKQKNMDDCNEKHKGLTKKDKDAELMLKSNTALTPNEKKMLGMITNPTGKKNQKLGKRR